MPKQLCWGEPREFRCPPAGARQCYCRGGGSFCCCCLSAAAGWPGPGLPFRADSAICWLVFLAFWVSCGSVGPLGTLYPFFFFFNWRLITLQYCGGFCHTFTWISHGCTCVPHPDPSSHLPPHPIPQSHPSAPALSTLSHASKLDWRSVSHMLIYMFQCYSLKSSHPCLLWQSQTVFSLYLCFFCCLAHSSSVNIY